MEVAAAAEEVIVKTTGLFDRSVAPVAGPDPSVTIPTGMAVHSHKRIEGMWH